jgi:hypothetical protein
MSSVITWKIILVVQNSGKVRGLSGALSAGLHCDTFLVRFDILLVIVYPIKVTVIK